MGSYSLSQNESNTSYTNAPITQKDVTNPVNLTNVNGAKIGSSEVSVGGSFSTSTQNNLTMLDQGAIKESFSLSNNALAKALDFAKSSENGAYSFGSNLVSLVADITKQTNTSAQTQTGKAIEGILSAKDETKQAGDWTQNKTLIYSIALVAVVFLWIKK